MNQDLWTGKLLEKSRPVGVPVPVPPLRGVDGRTGNEGLHVQTGTGRVPDGRRVRGVEWRPASDVVARPEGDAEHVGSPGQRQCELGHVDDEALGLRDDERVQRVAGLIVVDRADHERDTAPVLREHDLDERARGEVVAPHASSLRTGPAVYTTAGAGYSPAFRGSQRSDTKGETVGKPHSADSSSLSSAREFTHLASRARPGSSTGGAGRENGPFRWYPKALTSTSTTLASGAKCVDRRERGDFRTRLAILPNGYTHVTTDVQACAGGAKYGEFARHRGQSPTAFSKLSSAPNFCRERLAAEKGGLLALVRTLPQQPAKVGTIEQSGRKIAGALRDGLLNDSDVCTQRGQTSQALSASAEVCTSSLASLARSAHDMKSVAAPGRGSKGLADPPMRWRRGLPRPRSRRVRAPWRGLAVLRPCFHGAPEGHMVEVRDVLKTLAAHTGAQGEVMARFRALGGSSTRWQRRDRLAMAEALTRTEDAEELRQSGRWTAARLALRAIRRRSETELDIGERRRAA